MIIGGLRWHTLRVALLAIDPNRAQKASKEPQLPVNYHMVRLPYTKPFDRIKCLLPAVLSCKRALPKIVVNLELL
jgi:hypothetical protein